MKRLLLCFAIALFFLAGVAPAQTYDGLTIPTSRPRLFGFNKPAILAQATAWLNANPFTPAPSNSSNQYGCEDIALLHITTGSDCAPAITEMLSIAAAGPGGDPPYAVNNINDMPILVYDWCNNQLTSTQIGTFISDWNANWASYVNTNICSLLRPWSKRESFWRWDMQRFAHCQHGRAIRR
ncbi:MAG: hypothetical protein ACRD3N_10505 [Terracidiphilus sp.]